MGISKSGSMQGYSLKVWLKRNKETLKLLLTGIIGLIMFVSLQYMSIQLQSIITGIAAVVTKLGLDALDYFLSDVQLS